MDKKTFRLIHFFLSLGFMLSFIVFKIDILFGLGTLFTIWYLYDQFFDKEKNDIPLSEE